MGVLPVEFILRDVIAEEITAIKSDPSALDEILEGYTAFTIGGMPVVEYVQKYFSEVEVRSIIGWPRDNELIPCVAITVDDKRETHKFFGGFIDDAIMSGEYGGEHGGEHGGSYQDEVGFISTASYRIACLSNTSDIAVILGAIIETALTRNRLVLNEYGIKNNELQVSDNQPLPDYLPTSLYSRSVTLACQVATTAKLVYPTVKDVTTDVGTITV